MQENRLNQSFEIFVKLYHIFLTLFLSEPCVKEAHSYTVYIWSWISRRKINEQSAK